MTELRPIAADRIGLAAIRALHAEVSLHPKPGLVGPLDNGAHRDMDMGTFLRSTLALRHYFPAIARAGAAGAPFETLRRLGIEAEARMLAATGGVNTHRGAIFTLGLLAAGAGHGGDPCMTAARLWGPALLAAPRPDSHGEAAIRRHGAFGARSHAAAGFPLLRDVVLPALSCGADPRRARVQALFAAMAVMDDTNLLHRGGTAGLAFVQAGARAFLDAGGVFAPDWRDRAMALHHDCIARNLSPGGSADMLAAAIFLRALD